MRASRHPYVELHCHSAFSLLDGASLPDALVARAAALGYGALALTDHDDLGGVVAFAQSARERGIEGIVGAEITVEETGGRRQEAGETALTHLVLLAQDREGYGNLSTLITRARMENERGQPKVSLETVAAHARGLFALTGCPRGRVPSLVARGDVSGAREAAATLRDIFDGRIAIECWDHSLEQERAIVPHLMEIARALGVPWVVTNDVHYAEPEGRIVHDVLCALRHERTLDEMGTRLRPNGEWYLKSAEQMWQRWRHHPDGLLATLEIAERCAFRMHDLRPSLPAFPLPPGITADEYLARLVEEGGRERQQAAGSRKQGSARDEGPGSRDQGASRDPLAPGPCSLIPHPPASCCLLPASSSFPPPYHRQISHELSTIKRLGLAGYFLIVWDIVRFARREGILCQGRGSAANSVVCYCLGITAVDPIKLGLLFERFLSEDRQEAPDIDIDFAHRDRERVLQYVYERYGRDHAAMVCEQITYRDKSVRRDVERVMEGRKQAAGSRKQGGERQQAAESRKQIPAPLLEIPPPRWFPAACCLLPASSLLKSLPRHRSIHVGGFVLTEEPLASVVPIEPASMEGRTIIQWDKDDVEAMGLVKIDLLGLGMLTLIQDCLKYIRETRGYVVDLAALDYADPAVYDDLCRADTIGIFQVESRAQMSTLPRLKPRCFYDIVVQVALIRPGPIQGEMVHPYLRRRAGKEAVTYPHPSLKPILERTLGIPLFQEQGMRVAIEAAGFTPGEADALRRAMGSKRSRERMEAICEKLVAGMRRNGIPEDAARRIYAQIHAFADYGFPESHAASFALLVYASAYLKHYYAPEFLCAILNAQPMGFYSPSTLIEDARRHGVEVRGIDVTRSGYDTRLEEAGSRQQAAGNCLGGVTSTPERQFLATRDSRLATRSLNPAPPSLRLGLRLVKSLGPKAREKLERALREGGTFQSIGDLVRRSGLDRRALRSLAEAGALDGLVPDEPSARRRRAAVWRMLEELRGEAGALAPSRPKLRVPASVPAMSAMEITAADYRLTGVSIHGHPMRHLRALLAANDVKTARDAHALRDGERNVGVAGLVICRQRPPTAKGFAFLTLEDETGLVNVVVTPKRFERQAELISSARLLLVRGTIQVEESVVHLRGELFRELKADVGVDGVRGHDFH